MKTLITTLAIVLLTVCSARADYTLYWSPNSGASAGSPLSVDLYIKETNTTLINTYGISSAALRFTRTGVGVLGTPQGNAQFDAVSTGGADPTVALSETSIFGAGIGGGSDFLLATIQISPSVDGSGTLTVNGLNGSEDLTVYSDALGNFIDLGPSIFASAPVFNFSFSAVPEPTSFALAGVAAASGYIVRRWRNKRAR